MPTPSVLGPLASNMSAEESLRPLIRSCIAFIVVDTVIVLAKTYSRLQLAKLRFWWDDFWIIVAYVTLIPLCAFGLAMAHIETSWSTEDRIIADPDELEILLKIIYALLQFLTASYAATRYSILALYLRIFADKKLRIAVWVVAGFVTLQWGAFAIASYVQCNPVQFYWNKRIEGTCFDINLFYRLFTPFNIFVDVVVIVLPLPPIWNLKASNTRKWALSIFFGVGISALIASAIRLSVYTSHSSEIFAPSYTNILILWLVIEPSIYLIAACLPAMHHIFAAMVPLQIRTWVSLRMSRLGSTVIGRSHNGRNMSLRSDCQDPNSDERGLNLELGTAPGHPPCKNIAHAGRAGGNSSVDWGMMSKGIVVTKEVSVVYSEEERIQRVIGF